jgi:precorrin-3B methylase
VALQRLTGVDATDLLTAAYHQRSTRPNQLRAAIALLENARRHIAVTLTRSAYGKH